MMYNCRGWHCDASISVVDSSKHDVLGIYTCSCGCLYQRLLSYFCHLADTEPWACGDHVFFTLQSGHLGGISIDKMNKSMDIPAMGC